MTGLFLLVPAVVKAINPGGFPNSITAPLRGWRSWNAVFSDITQEFMIRQVEGLARRRHSIDGKPTSLLDLGFDRAGIDSGWAECTGVNGSWHDASGHFLINKTRFPDMKAMTNHAHKSRVKMDFYLNQDLDPEVHGCKSEGQIPGAAANSGNFASYRNDAADAAALGFDGIKFDSGGGNDNMTLWAMAVNATGREMMLENCNNGGYVPYGIKHGLDEGCPFNMFRTGIDNSPSPLSMLSNLMDTERYLNVSRPGCWACKYPLQALPRFRRLSSKFPLLFFIDPDMLEIGAPVVGRFASTWPNKFGPGSRHSMCNGSDGTAGDTAPRLSLEQAKAEFAGWCTVSAPLILGFDLGNDTEYDRWWPLLSNRRALGVQAEWAGVAGKLLSAESPPTLTSVIPHGASCEDMKDTRTLPGWSLWGKPLTKGRYALTAYNIWLDHSTDISINLEELGLHGTVDETDVWSGTREIIRGAKWKATLPPSSHRFVILSNHEESHQGVL